MGKAARTILVIICIHCKLLAHRYSLSGPLAPCSPTMLEEMLKILNNPVYQGHRSNCLNT